MPIRYAFKPEYNLLLYVFEGYVDATEYFKAYKAAYQDARRQHGMLVLMDLEFADMDFDVDGLRAGVELVRENHAAGFSPDHVAIVTASSIAETFPEVFKLLADGVPIHLNVFHTHESAIRWLGLAEKGMEILRFWDEFKAGNV